MKDLHSIACICFLLYISRVANTTSPQYEPLELRLTSEHEGRVEVSNGGPWGPLCDDRWTANDANVVCRTLGYTHALFPNVTGHDVEVSGSGDLEMDEVFSDTVRCVGNETNIAFCPMNVSFSDRCDENDGVNVNCEGIVKVRLEDGTSDREGRVEVFHRGSWGTVCDNNFGLHEANVVCRMLEFGFADRYYAGGLFGAGTSEILVDDLQCMGDELNIGQCSPKYTGTHNCTHESDVGISCVALPVRLVEGGSPNKGRVEVHFEGSWGTICDDDWNMKSGNVVCRMLGYPGVLKAYGVAYYGEGIGQIILDRFECNGGESHIARCGQDIYGKHNCGHHEDSGVDCSGEATSNIRLRDGPDPSQGRLELYLMGAWGTACLRNWTSIDSSVVCRKLGYLGAADTLSGPTSYGKGTGLVLVQEPRCEGKESDLLQCDIAYPLGVTNCTHDEDVWVNCLQKENLEVRLVGGQSSNKGRVEVLHRGRWGTICDDNWNILDSHVVCRMMGFDVAEDYGHFGEGSGVILLDEVQCNGAEENLGHCMREDYGVHDCDHSEDVGVSCISYVSKPTVSFSQSSTEKPRTGFPSVLSTGNGFQEPL
ncbi:deleted in malignant brain tumors 1 protein [Strongylocentrotus purpuratus]|uniref:SRCR domain-containing protein n=1 Tax=Strongylocentrotus purpuratus TaxID=7668 RepID=A0A7M7SXP8_STRPU|nr:deleted in malignant brain tumors 1 protein [Strongylocentrotus purpuratus]